MYCTTVVPKRSRDSVSDDVAFRRPAVELLVVTMHGWALPCHPKVDSEHLPRRLIGCNFTTMFSTRVLTICHHIPHQLPNSSLVCGFMAFFLISPKRHIALTAPFFSLRSRGKIVGVHQQNVAPKFQHLNLRFTRRKITLLGVRIGGVLASVSYPRYSTEF